MTIRVLKNFGHNGANLAVGTDLDVNPEEFGGTYADFLAGGFFEELQPAVIEPASKKGGKGAGKDDSQNPPA